MTLAEYEDTVASAVPLLHPSVPETRRFGLQVGRIAVPVGARYSCEAIMDIVAQSGLDIVIVRYPASHADWFVSLASTAYATIHADTLLYLRKRHIGPCQDQPRLDLRLVATAQDSEVLGDLAERCFDQYRSHYFANPLIDRAAIAAGYGEWARSFAPTDERGAAYFAYLDEHLVGFVVHSHEPEPELILVAVAPGFGGRHLYGEIVRAIGQRLSVNGHDSCSISTQVHNLAVLRSVISLGFTPCLALQTVHLVRRELLVR
jgi:hypothetical protein